MSKTYVNEFKTHGFIPARNVLYLCDPKKAKDCQKTTCYQNNRHPEWGKCKWTDNPAHSKDGKEYRYNDETGKVELVK